jgi:hypothetical protein
MDPLLVVVAVALGIPFVLTRTPIAGLIGRLVHRGEARRMEDPLYALLRREVEKVGKEFEAMPYERLLEPAEHLSLSKVVDGVEICFSAEAFNVWKNGDIGFCVDAHAEPNRTWAQPSYQFFKRRDGSVYY